MTPEQKFQSDITYRTHRLQHFAKKYGWKLAGDDGKAFKFVSPHYAILKIGYWKLEVETSLSHPEWGDTVLLRKGDFTQKIIESIFRNPRHHMGKKVKSRYLDHQA